MIFMKKVPVVLTVAGSDPGGGAGVEADIKTFTSLGVYGCSVVTAHTVQNTLGVSEVYPVDKNIIAKQLEALFSDIEVDVVKVGMIGSLENAKLISNYLRNRIVVFDTVYYSKNGFELTKGEEFKEVFGLFARISYLITPNYVEFQRVAEDDDFEFSKRLLEENENLRGVLIKGGHFDENSKIIMDRLFLKDKNKIELLNFKHNRIKTKNLHGTGCTLSSAIAAFLAKGYKLEDAVRKAINYVYRLIKISRDISLGHGNGPLFHCKS